MQTNTKKRTLLFFGMLFALSIAVLFSTKSEAASKTGWVSGGTTYYQKNGKKITGLQKIGNYYYYFDSKGRMTTGWKTIKGKKFYFKKTGTVGQKGRMLTGWTKIGKYTYYFKATGGKYTKGSLLTGRVKIGKYTYYFKKTGKTGQRGKMLTGWRKLGKYTYYFKKTGGNGTKGRMLTGWHTISKKYFYFNKSGHLLTGSHKISGKTFYFRKTGKTGVKGSVFTGTRTVNNTTYYYRTTGKIGVKGALYKTTKKTSTQSKPMTPQTTKNMTKSQFVAYVGNLARKDMKKTGILASVTTAQAILESNYGQSGLARNANNLFGIKAGTVWNASAWNGRIYQTSTREYLNGRYVTIVDKFRAYDSWEKSVLDHSYYLRKAKNGSKLRYAGISTCRDYRRAAQIIKNGGYATAPNYVEVLCNIIKSWNLTKYDV